MKKIKTFKEYLEHYGFTVKKGNIYDAANNKLSQKSIDKLKEYFEDYIKKHKDNKDEQ